MSLFPISAGTAGGNVCKVPQDEATIQDAVDNDACSRIELGAMTYGENITIDRNVTIVGKGMSKTIIDGGAAAGVIEVTTRSPKSLCAISQLPTERTSRERESGRPATARWYWTG